MSKSLPCVFAYFAIAVTILSQFADGISAAVYLPLWAVALLVSVWSKGGTIRFGHRQTFIILLFCIMGACACLSLLYTGEQGYLTGFFMLVVKSLLLYFVGWFLSPHFGAGKNEKTILLVYIVASIVYAGWFVVTYVPSLTAWAQSQQYLFSQKNSFGQIAGVAALCSAYIALGCENKGRALLFVAAAFCLVVAVSLAQCRTAILAFCVGAIVLLCLLRRKRLFLLLLSIVIVTLMGSPEFRGFFAHVLFLDKYSGADFGTFASGRSGLWDMAIKVWLNNPLIGTGSYYVDNLYVNCLANVGIIGTIFMLAVWVPRIVANARYATSPAISGRFFFANLACALAAFYLVESLLEGNPPFGPGSSSFLFWLIGGMLDGQVQGGDKNEMEKFHA